MRESRAKYNKSMGGVLCITYKYVSKTHDGYCSGLEGCESDDESVKKTVEERRLYVPIVSELFETADLTSIATYDPHTSAAFISKYCAELAALYTPSQKHCCGGSGVCGLGSTWEITTISAILTSVPV